jgi:hypothetical protein
MDSLWLPISLSEFNDHTNDAYPISATSDIALEHWGEKSGSLLGVIVLNGIDQDYGYVVLGRDQHSRFRAIDVVCSHPSIGEARAALLSMMREILKTGATVFPQDCLQ